ncbi:unnamed protein product [Angiostrongylus costaricensis]|uniref:Paired domain-containing protein n=1 Tax=Angiostrongylus costaricensis TaxID=334426 RepID=A0A3P7HEP3_ANGCS|nr:unnamed protein product [Angiostrongylus costaricensis]
MFFFDKQRLKLINWRIGKIIVRLVRITCRNDGSCSQNIIVTGTNLYGRPYCPGRPLSMVERRRIIDLHMSGMKVNAISKALCISHGCVSKIISRLDFNIDIHCKRPAILSFPALQPTTFPHFVSASNSSSCFVYSSLFLKLEGAFPQQIWYCLAEL